MDLKIKISLLYCHCCGITMHIIFINLTIEKYKPSTTAEIILQSLKPLLHENHHLKRPIRCATHVVLHQVGMVLLYPIIQDGHHHTFTCVAQLPRSFGIQVAVVTVVLRGKGSKQPTKNSII